MNRETIQGKWKQISGEVKKRWGRLTDDELAQADGNVDILVGKIQERYGKRREEVQKEVDAVLDKCGCN